MVVRQIVATAWALVLGPVGGWLMLMPWAVGFQSGGGWTDATKSEFGTGAFLVLLAVAALWIAVADVVAGLRELGVIRPRPKPEPPEQPEPARPAAAQSELDMDSLLGALARVLADELSRREDRADLEDRESRLPSREAPWRNQT
ncbi:MAG: hypothetical protein J2P40_05480 [Candidatus Dormibacteraeota bacterium]|nr:hypothetical protein [Candidatus Dormibacteraeota bacterium]MBO0760710.1 hypothetical protein [Candidatus Dormibacteraeota bacterium]